MPGPVCPASPGRTAAAEPDDEQNLRPQMSDLLPGIIRTPTGGGEQADGTLGMGDVPGHSAGYVMSKAMVAASRGRRPTVGRLPHRAVGAFRTVCPQNRPMPMNAG